VRHRIVHRCGTARSIAAPPDCRAPAAPASVAPMPIEPPDPTGKILDTLRTALAALHDLADLRPEDQVLAKVALGSVDVAIVALEAVAARKTA